MTQLCYVQKYGNGEESFFIHLDTCKNGNAKGLAFDDGASGRSRRKPVKTTVDLNRDWTLAETVPDYVAKHLTT